MILDSKQSFQEEYLDEVGQAKRESALRQQKEESMEDVRVNSTHA